MSAIEDVKCPACGGPMTPRASKHGKFWGCKAYPECKGTRDSMGLSKADRGRRRPEASFGRAPRGALTMPNPTPMPEKVYHHAYRDKMGRLRSGCAVPLVRGNSMPELNHVTCPFCLKNYLRRATDGRIWRREES